MKETKEQLIARLKAMPRVEDFICGNCRLWYEDELDEDKRHFCDLKRSYMEKDDTCDDCMVNGCERLDLLIITEDIAEFYEN